MMTEARRSSSVMSARRGVNPLTKEESQEPISKMGRAPDGQSRPRDDQAVERASDSEHDRVESYVSEAWTGEASNRTRR